MAKGTCSLTGCDSPVRNRGWCNKHYQRWWKHGDPRRTSRPSYRERLLGRTSIRPDGCVVWTGPVLSTGYGQMRPEDGSANDVGVHRLVYEMFVGPIPEGYQIHHLCRVKLCVAPYHLEAIDMVEHSRTHHPVQATCGRGHDMHGDNLYVNPKSGKRRCRACTNDAQNLRRRRTREGTTSSA